MSWRRGKAYAQDLRDRVLVATGRLGEVAKRFGVSQAYVSRVRSRHERLGQTSAGATAQPCAAAPGRFEGATAGAVRQAQSGPDSQQTLTAYGQA